MDEKRFAYLSKATQQFIKLAWPILREHTVFTDLFVIEHSKSSQYQELDMSCGIDLIVTTESGLTYGLASRNQFSYRYDTFTIRYERIGGSKTEYAKRCEWIESGCEGIGPQFAIQSYFNADGSQFRQMALVRTVDMFHYIQRYEKQAVECFGCREIDRPPFYLDRGEKSNLFFVVPWDELRERDVEVWSWKFDHDPQSCGEIKGVTTQ